METRVVENHNNENYEDISLLKNEFNKSDTNRRSSNHDYYNWKLNNNISGKGVCKIVTYDYRVVSMTTVTLKTFLLNNEEKICGEIGDTFTSSDFQRKGLFTKLVNSAREQSENENINFIYGTPNENSLPGYEKKLNFKAIPDLKVFNFIYPINSSKVLNQKINNSPISSIISLIIDPILKLKTTITTPSINKNINIIRLNKTTEDFDDIWESEKFKYDCIMVRDSKYIQWRFFDNPDSYNLYVAKKNNKPVGYIVLKEGLWRDLKVGYIADIFTIEDGKQTVFNSLINYAKEHFISKDMDMISTWVQNGIYSKKLKSFGFLKFKYMPVICYANKLGTEILNGKMNWYFTMADSDNI